MKRRRLGPPGRGYTEEINSEDDVDDLSLLGFVALADPVRDSAAPAADRLREAGVRTVMITGDRLETIVAALVEGRSMWAPVREALGILLGGNLGGDRLHRARLGRAGSR